MIFEKVYRADSFLTTCYCPCCKYKIITFVSEGKTEVIEGDKEFTFYPYFSLQGANGERADLCSCPMCHTIQKIEYLT